MIYRMRIWPGAAGILKRSIMPTHVSFENKIKQLNYALKGVIVLKRMIEIRNILTER